MDTTMTTLAFQGIEIEPVIRDSHTWLRMPQIEEALGYASKGRALAKIFTTHSDEFTASMTRVLKLGTAGGKQAVRVFSLRGAHLLAMFARTPAAKAFRKWVLDILDGELGDVRPVATLGTEQLESIKSILNRRVMEAVTVGIPDMMNRGPAIAVAYRRVGAALLAKFSVDCVTKIPAREFAEARTFLENEPISWHLVDNVPAPAAPKYHFPLASAEPHDRDQSFGNCSMTARVLLDPRNRAPEMELIAALERDGHDVTGARLRIIGLRQAVEKSERNRHRMANWEARLDALKDEIFNYQREEGMSILFSRAPDPANHQERVCFPHQMPRRDSEQEALKAIQSAGRHAVRGVAA